MFHTHNATQSNYYELNIDQFTRKEFFCWLKNHLKSSSYMREDFYFSSLSKNILCSWRLLPSSSSPCTNFFWFFSCVVRWSWIHRFLLHLNLITLSCSPSYTSLPLNLAFSSSIDHHGWLDSAYTDLGTIDDSKLQCIIENKYLMLKRSWVNFVHFSLFIPYQIVIYITK